MPDKYLNKDRLTQLWAKIKALANTKVSKSGDTMTGTLNVVDGGDIRTTGDCNCFTLHAQSAEFDTSSASASTVVKLAKSDVDASKANNNLPSGTEYAAIYTKDTGGRNIGKFGSNIESNGVITSEIYAHNFNTSGETVSNNYLRLSANKDGTVLVGCSNPQAWREATGTGGSTLTFNNWHNIVPFRLDGSNILLFIYGFWLRAGTPSGSLTVNAKWINNGQFTSTTITPTAINQRSWGTELVCKHSGGSVTAAMGMLIFGNGTITSNGKLTS